MRASHNNSKTIFPNNNYRLLRNPYEPIDMASPDREDDIEPETLLVETLEDPARGTERLPYVVGLFEDDSRLTRLCAAWTCCVIATETDDQETIEYIMRRLSDRLDSDYATLELTTTLDYISTEYPEQVERILGSMDDERERVPLPRVGDFTRNHYYNNTPGREGVGRTTLASGPDSASPRTAHIDENTVENDRGGVREREGDRERAGDRSGNEADESGASTEGSDTGKGGNGGGPMAQQRTEVAGIAGRSRFDKLHILASRERSRYGDVYEALVGDGGDERAVALCLLRQPDERNERSQFSEAIRRELERWEGVDDSDHVVTIQDWGIDPRPWVVTDFTSETLAESSQLPAERALSDALDLTTALSHLHRNDVVHGGIDPESIAYTGEILDEDEQPPLLDNVGLLNAVRFYLDPSLCLDPRYAAPEYFDRQYGRIDHSTDIYQLGAVLYRLFTGDPPYSGAFADVRAGVLERDPTPPSQVADGVSETLDEIIAKAMAKPKLTRYETVEQLEGELAGLGGTDDG